MVCAEDGEGVEGEEAVAWWWQVRPLESNEFVFVYSQKIKKVDTTHQTQLGHGLT